MATTVDVAPFHTCPSHVDHVAYAPFEVDGLPWDMNTELTVRSRVSVDVDALRECTRLPAAPLAVVLEVVCDQAYWTRRSVRPLPQEGSDDLDVVVRVPPRTVAGFLRIAASIVVAEPAAVDTGRSASRSGSVVSTSGRNRVVLEGGADQFPTAVVPFGTTGRVRSARWTVEYSYDTPEQPVLGCARLLLNSDSSDVQRMLARESADQDDLVGSVGAELRRFVLGDVIRQAVEDEGFDGIEVWPEDSLGQLVADVLDRYMDGISLGQLRAMRVSDRGRFEQLLQSVVPESLYE